MEKCPKCGMSNISVKFLHEDSKIYWSEHKEIKNISEFTRNDRYYTSDRVIKECLRYKCNTCSYMEVKKPLVNA